MLNSYPREFQRLGALGWVMEEYIEGLFFSEVGASIRQSVMRWGRQKLPNAFHLTCQEQSWEQTAPTKTKFCLSKEMSQAHGHCLLHLVTVFLLTLIFLTRLNIPFLSWEHTKAASRRKKGFSQQAENKERENYFFNWPKSSKMRMEPFNWGSGKRIVLQ